ncbi:MAG: glycosyltransferase, partial [Candidatus Cloacimonadota bacterium]|nr:glycosyltransferase [Candidatus Cloacimonadota bacterium]
QQILRGKNIEVVHTHNPVASFYGGICAKIAGIKAVVNTRHGMGNAPHNKKENFFTFIRNFRPHLFT